MYIICAHWLYHEKVLERIQPVLVKCGEVTAEAKAIKFNYDFGENNVSNSFVASKTGVVRGCMKLNEKYVYVLWPVLLMPPIDRPTVVLPHHHPIESCLFYWIKWHAHRHHHPSFPLRLHSGLMLFGSFSALEKLIQLTHTQTLTTHESN